MALIDTGVLLQMVAARIEAVRALESIVLPVLYPRRMPENPESCYRLDAITLARRKRRISAGLDEPDKADATLTVTVMIGQQYASDAALECAESQFAAALIGVLLTDPADTPTDHTLLFEDIDQSARPTVDQERRIVAKEIAFSGMATRLTGSSIRDFLS